MYVSIFQQQFYLTPMPNYLLRQFLHQITPSFPTYTATHVCFKLFLPQLTQLDVTMTHSKRSIQPPSLYHFQKTTNWTLLSRSVRRCELIRQGSLRSANEYVAVKIDKKVTSDRFIVPNSFTQPKLENIHCTPSRITIIGPVISWVVINKGMGRYIGNTLSVRLSVHMSC